MLAKARRVIQEEEHAACAPDVPLFKVFKDGSLDACFAGPRAKVRETAFQEYEPKAVGAVGGAGDKEEFALEGDQVG